MTIPDPEALFVLQLELECTRIEPPDRLVPFPCTDPDEPHAVLVVRFPASGREAVYFRDDLGEQAILALKQYPLNAIRTDQVFVDRTLGRTTSVFRGTTYAIGRQIVSDSELVTRFSEHDEGGHAGSFVIAIDSEAVSGCSSSRENHRCAEAWVWTAPGLRRKGYAKACVAAWSAEVRRLSKIPFYSHAADNSASRALAVSLGLQPAFEIVGYA